MASHFTPQDIENAQDMMCLRQLMEGKGDPELIRQATYYYTHESYKIKTASTFDSWLLRHGSDEIEQDYRTRMGTDGSNSPCTLGDKIPKVSSKAPRKYRFTLRRGELQ